MSSNIKKVNFVKFPLQIDNKSKNNTVTKLNASVKKKDRINTNTSHFISRDSFNGYFARLYQQKKKNKVSECRDIHKD